MGGVKNKSWNQQQKDSDSPSTSYAKFETLNGQHPWMKSSPNGYVGYNVRELHQGDVAYFNYNLAKEMGLISIDHPEEMNAQLKKKLLSTFSIRIINEYDKENNVTFHPRLIKPHKFMATRYLQLQHANKQGKTSGDGRCIWNGTVKHNGKTWDVSSRGTGVTVLAPGSVDAKSPLKTGNTDFGYGCGLAEIDELYSAAIMSEILHNRSMPTERMLTIIDLGDGTGIGVRAGTNLIRPAHLFMFLKQSRYEELKQATDYLIDRQIQNGDWQFNTKTNKKYDYMLAEISNSFSKFLALLDREYIFMWLDWDGDNVLADAGIIDYGSIRQFGLRHDQYRYDDVQRFSTTLNEQFTKGRQILSVFIQLVDYIKSGTKKPLKEFENDPLLKQFKSMYEIELQLKVLQQAGFNENQSLELLKKIPEQVALFYQSISYVESTKSLTKIRKVDDGINRPALLDFKVGLQKIAQNFLKDPHNPVPFSSSELYTSMVNPNASQRDSKFRPAMHRPFRKWQKSYWELLHFFEQKPKTENIILQVTQTLAENYAQSNVTGNGLIYLVDEIIRSRKSGKSHRQVQRDIDFLVKNQSPSSQKTNSKTLKNTEFRQILLSLIEENKHSI